jgi:hypothetical protein
MRTGVCVAVFQFLRPVLERQQQVSALSMLSVAHTVLKGLPGGPSVGPSSILGMGRVCRKRRAGGGGDALSERVSERWATPAETRNRRSG